MSYVRTYYLKHFDTPLVLFSASIHTANPNIEVIEVYDEHSDLLPYGFAPTDEGLYKWIKRRFLITEHMLTASLPNAGFHPTDLWI